MDIFFSLHPFNGNSPCKIEADGGRKKIATTDSVLPQLTSIDGLRRSRRRDDGSTWKVTRWVFFPEAATGAKNKTANGSNCRYKVGRWEQRALNDNKREVLCADRLA